MTSKAAAANPFTRMAASRSFLTYRDKNYIVRVVIGDEVCAGYRSLRAWRNS